MRVARTRDTLCQGRADFWRQVARARRTPSHLRLTSCRPLRQLASNRPSSSSPVSVFTLDYRKKKKKVDEKESNKDFLLETGLPFKLVCFAMRDEREKKENNLKLR